MFNKYAPRTSFNDKALKCHLRCALSEELAKQLVTTNLKELTYDALVTECQLQDNQLRAAISTNTRRHINKPTPPRYVNNITTPVKVTTVLVTSVVPRPRSPNAMDLSKSKLTPQERERRRTQGLCFYCGNPGHVSTSCPNKPSRINAIDTDPVKPVTTPPITSSESEKV